MGRKRKCQLCRGYGLIPMPSGAVRKCACKSFITIRGAAHLLVDQVDLCAVDGKADACFCVDYAEGLLRECVALFVDRADRKRRTKEAR